MNNDKENLMILSMTVAERIGMSLKAIYFFILNERDRLAREVEEGTGGENAVAELEVYKRLVSLFNAQITEMTSILDEDEEKKDQD